MSQFTSPDCQDNLFVLQIALTFSPLYKHLSQFVSSLQKRWCNIYHKPKIKIHFTCYFDSAPRDILSCTLMSKSYSSYFFPSVFCLRNIYVCEVWILDWVAYNIDSFIGKICHYAVFIAVESIHVCTSNISTLLPNGMNFIGGESSISTAAKNSKAVLLCTWDMNFSPFPHH